MPALYTNAHETNVSRLILAYCWINLELLLVLVLEYSSTYLPVPGSSLARWLILGIPTTTTTTCITYRVYLDCTITRRDAHLPEHPLQLKDSSALVMHTHVSSASATMCAIPRTRQG